MYFFFIKLFFLVATFYQSLFATEQSDLSSGTLIVSYHTGPKAERLNRIRFLLIDQENNEKMYPKGNSFIEDLNPPSRMVAIENLPKGPYRLKFLVPNTDALFENVPERTVLIDKDEVVRIDQYIHPQYGSLKAITEMIPEDRLTTNSPTITIIDKEGNIHAKSKSGKLITHSLLPGTYTIHFDPITNYITPNPIKAEVTPGQSLGTIIGTYLKSTDNLNEASKVIVKTSTLQKSTAPQIAYSPVAGYINLETTFPEGEAFTVVIKPRNGPSLSFKLKSKGGFISWHSPPLPPGLYEVAYVLPEDLQPVRSSRVIVRNGERVELTPRLITQSMLRVTSNISEGIYILRLSKDSRAWKGEGREYLFKGLSSGNYTLSFSTKEPDYFIPPEEMRFTLSELENKTIKATYQLIGKLKISTNIPESLVEIQEIGGKQKNYRYEITESPKLFSLPEGFYKITLSTPTSDKPSGKKTHPPDPMEVRIKAMKTETLNLDFKMDNVSSEDQLTLNVSANISNAGVTVSRLDGEMQEIIGHFTGKNLQINVPKADSYELVFDDLPNYETPKTIITRLSLGEEKNFQVSYAPNQELALVSEGPVIIGDALSEDTITSSKAKKTFLSSFSIGIYEITNAQYAHWLNQALKKNTITYVKEADAKGQVLDLQGRILFKTFEADPYSQISAQLQSTDTPIFLSLPGKNLYPVINVSWYGATAYCEDNNCRLPTEAEWEKAGGMALPQPDQKLKKYKFGFSRDEIDSSWANYKQNTQKILHFQVLTTPVGFYNGLNSLPLNSINLTQQQTQYAVSPYGLFDMSGNVWEWVSDWFDDNYIANLTSFDPKGPNEGTLKIVKGGCYDSLAEGVRVSERLGLPPEHADAYTGFRIAIDIKSENE